MPKPVVVPAGRGRAFTLHGGQSLKLINTHGTQVVDCWAWNAADLHEHMSMEATRVWNQRLNPVVGDSFVTNRRNPILTLVEDTSPGVHDTLMAACDRHRYARLGVQGHHRNCIDNQLEAMAELGATPPAPIWASFNIFMNIRVGADGRTLETLPTVSRPGDHLILRAEMPCLVALSACPQDIVAIQGQGDNTLRDVAVELVDDGYPHIPPSPAWVPR